MARRHNGRGRAAPPSGVVPGTPGLAASLAGRLAPAHVRELRELCGVSPAEALRDCLAGSVEWYCYAPEGEPVLAMGVGQADAITGGAMPWMLGTADLARHPRGTLRAARWGIDRAFLITGAAWLEQYIPEWYGTGLRFARRIGFHDGVRGLRTGTGTAVRQVVLPRPSPYRSRAALRRPAIPGIILS